MERAKGRRTIDVLLVEDNQGDVILVRQALEAADATLRLHVVADGLSALAFVRDRKPRPHLIILDLSLPGKSGSEVLNELKADAEFMEIPVVVFSSSSAAKDVRNAYRSQACGYIRKPSDVDEFFEAIAGLNRYWAQTVLLPPL